MAQSEYARKHRGERKEFSFDYTRHLQSGDSLLESPTPTVELFFIGDGNDAAVERTDEWGDLDVSIDGNVVVFWGNQAQADSEQAVGYWAVKITAYTALGEQLVAEIRAPGGYMRPLIRVYGDPEES